MARIISCAVSGIAHQRNRAHIQLAAENGEVHLFNRYYIPELLININVKIYIYYFILILKYIIKHI